MMGNRYTGKRVRPPYLVSLEELGITSIIVKNKEMKNMNIRQDYRKLDGVYFTGITLGKDDIVKVGVYSTHGMKVSTVLKRYGKKGVMNLLLHYDLEEEILEEYHIHRLSPEEKEMRDRVEEMNKVQEDTNVSVPVKETFETTTTQEVDEEYPDQEEYDEGDNWDYPVLFDPEDEEGYGGYWGYGSNSTPRLYRR